MKAKRKRHDNAFNTIYIERFWRSIKYEGIFLHEYSTLPDLQDGLATWIHQYNTWRPHQALD
ncbi:MAG: integrase core domain-containing protein, partial [Verrucomicrobiae bacterium]|nr:integrase core domain-containing protein [Verrucomicrobiae bacterium]